jgi:hypothetical protein
MTLQEEYKAVSIRCLGDIDFFIVGLPRCRMAWIANYLTYGDTECHFDGFVPGLYGEGPDVIEMYYNPEKVVGVADGAALMFQDRLIEKYPHAKWVVITRPHPTVIASVKKLGIPIDDRLTTLHYKMGELRAKVQPLVVPFDSLDKSIKDIATFVNPSWKCPQWRHDMLVGLNVQTRITQDDLVKIPLINPLSKAAEPVTPTKTQDDFFKLIQEICGDNKLAYRWLWQAIEVASILDHVMDSELIDFQHFDTVMKGVLLEWGINEFYKKNAIYLSPVMSQAIASWQHSTGSFKRAGHYNIYTSVPTAVAFLMGGQEYVDKFAPRLHALVEQLEIEDTKRDGETL